MARREIVVRADTNGRVFVETFGFGGSVCKDATRALERRLGAVVRDTIKPEAGGAAAQWDEVAEQQRISGA